MQIHADKGIDPPYPVYGGLFREEAIMLLRRFYVQENDKGTMILLSIFNVSLLTPLAAPAPEPKPKKNRELKTEILPVTVATPTAHASRTSTPKG